MERKRRREWAALVTILGIVLLFAPPALYLLGYFFLARVEEGYWMPERIPVVHRTYPMEWLETLYSPAGEFEERFTNREVEIGTESP